MQKHPWMKSSTSIQSTVRMTSHVFLNVTDWLTALVIAITEKPTTKKHVSAQDAATTEEELKVLKAKLDSLAQKPK